MTPAQEAVVDMRAEQECRSHRGLLPGRDFRWNVERFRTDLNNRDFEDNYDRIFPHSPGSPGWWWKKRFKEDL